jgi:hypothetical protein
MDRETEDEVMAAWWDLTSSQPDAQERFRLIKSAVRQLLPNEVDSATVAFVATEPAVLAVSGLRIFSVQVGVEASSSTLAKTLGGIEGRP